MNLVCEESIIFNKLAKLCSSPGYVHVIAYFCLRYNTVWVSEKLCPDDIRKLHKPESLIHTEISTLIGLLVKNEINLTLPSHDAMQSMIDKTEALLSDLHQSLSHPMQSHLENALEQNVDSFGIGSAMREPIFYGGESAYDFQYLDFALKKYAKDNVWLKTNKGFSIADAREVIRNILEVHRLKIQNYLESMKEMRSDNMRMLSAFIFKSNDLKNCLYIDSSIVNNVLFAFSMSMGRKNETFSALNDFNITNSCPLIRLGNDQYLLFQHYSLVESLYESPFYWMNDDKKYMNQAMKNRGDFVEKFSAERLRHVFGDKRVFSNINILNSAARKKGIQSEIDVLVVFGDRAIILQTKSKRLTIDAKRGNDNVIKKDFCASIQNAYNQGLLCAKLLSNKESVLIDSNSNNINIRRQFSEIYIFCVISDHYPALSFQSRQFLKWEEVDNIKPPIVMDIFFLDVMTEMLSTPLYLLSYANRRTSYIDKILAHHEITILSFFMTNNLWFGNDEHVYFDDGVSSDVDSAMTVRRLGMPGKTTPDGFLARLTNGRLGNILKMIAESDEPVAIDLGFLLLTLSLDTINTIEQALEKIFIKSKNGEISSDFSILIENETGLTVHSNQRLNHDAMKRLRVHCEMKKYSEKVKSWYGLCIYPDNCVLRFAIKVEYPWKQSNSLDDLLRNWLRS